MIALARRFAAVLCGLALAATIRPAAATTFHVAPDGSDANPGTPDKPFQTILKARDAVRRLNDDLSEDRVIVLHGGTHTIRQTVVFEPGDSGTCEHPVVYRAQPGETPIISGGVKLTGWTRDADGKRWKTKTDIPNFRQLHVNGRRAIRAQGPPPRGLALEGKNGYRTEAAEMAHWRNPTDIEFCYPVVWTHSRCKVAGIAKQGTRAAITMLQPWFSLAREKEGVSIELPAYIENALELLDEPGEWYLDRSRHEVYYLPRPGEDMATAEVIAPVAEQLLEFKGKATAPVAYLRFEGLTFSHADWLRPSETGFVDLQANFTLAPGTNLLTRNQHVTMVHNEAIKSPAHILCRGTHHLAFERCVFTQLGGAGIDFDWGAHDNQVHGCQFFDIGGSAIQIGNVLRADHHPEDPRLLVRSNTVTHCDIHDCACLYQGGVGVFAGYTEGTLIAHNAIHDMPYSAISLGWGWGEEDAGGSSNYYQPFHYSLPTPAKNNLVAANHIYHVMQRMNDGGAIYTLGNQPGTVIRGNHLHDSKGTPGGIYLDEGSGFIELASNVVYGVHTPINYNNQAQDRIKSCREHDNYLNPEGCRALVQGKRGSGLFCTGQGTGLEIPHAAGLEPEQLTLEAWIWAAAIPGGEDARRWIVNKNTHEFTDGHYALMLDGDKVGAYLNIGGGEAHCYEAWGAGGLKAKTWYHLAMTYDGKVLRVYLGGNLAASKSVNLKRTPGTTSLAIGHRQDGFVAFHGILDEVRLYRRALLATEVQTNLRGPAAKEGLAAEWTFEEAAKPASAVQAIMDQAGPAAGY